MGLASQATKGDLTKCDTCLRERADEIRNKDSVYSQMDVDIPPKFANGQQDITHFIRRNFTYPEEAAMEGIEGTVIISYEIDEQGKIDNIKIVKGVGYGLDEAAIELIKKMPNYEPAKLNSRNVRTKLTIPVKFQLYK